MYRYIKWKIWKMEDMKVNITDVCADWWIKNKENNQEII